MASGKDKPTRHTELERKFAPAETAVAPSFEGLSSVSRVERAPVQQLDAVYFDTPAHDLASNRVTLRRRTGGPDAGWHLKLPAGPDARTELRVPLEGHDDHTVPDELRDVVLAIVRDRPLGPVARIETSRTVDVLYGSAGVAVAEFCDDRVTATAGDSHQAWREWELELVGDVGNGDDGALLGRLANRLLDAGAEPAGHGSKLAKVLEQARGDEPVVEREPSSDPVHRAVAEQVAELVVWDRAVRADTWDSVHQMRVVTRKIRSLLRASEASFGLTDDAWVLEELKLLAGLLGVARDAEVLAEKYEKALGELPSDLVRGPVRERLVDGARQRYEAGWKRALVAMRSARYFRLLDGLDDLVATEPGAATEGVQTEPPTVESSYRQVRKATKRARAAAADESVSPEHRDEALHKIRKRAKQLRYTASALGEDTVADGAKAIQSLLGDHQDSVVSRVHLLQESLAAHAAGEDTFTYGVLFEREADVARRAEEQLAGALKRLKKAM